MPPRYTYWTIILEGKPTAFRARTPDELAPTLKQLQARHPDAVMKWFARGRLWASEEEAREALVRKRQPQERRGPAWRPGGSHEDPRARFKVPRDEKRRRFRERLFRDHTPDDRDAPVRDGERPGPRPPRPHGPHSKPQGAPGSKNRPPRRDGDTRWRAPEDRAGQNRSRPPSDRKPGWKPNRPPGAGGGDRDRPWKRDRPAGDDGQDRSQGGSHRNRGWRPDRPERQGGGWKPNRPGGRAPGAGSRGRRPPGSGGGKGGGGGSSR